MSKRTVTSAAKHIYTKQAKAITMQVDYIQHSCKKF
jgi:hypothetical protein